MSCIVASWDRNGRSMRPGKAVAALLRQHPTVALQSKQVSTGLGIAVFDELGEGQHPRHVRETARLLGLGSATVYRKIKRYGLSPADHGRPLGSSA